MQVNLAEPTGCFPGLQMTEIESEPIASTGIWNLISAITAHWSFLLFSGLYRFMSDKVAACKLQPST